MQLCVLLTDHAPPTCFVRTSSWDSSNFLLSPLGNQSQSLSIVHSLLSDEKLSNCWFTRPDISNLVLVMGECLFWDSYDEKCFVLNDDKMNGWTRTAKQTNDLAWMSNLSLGRKDEMPIGVTNRKKMTSCWRLWTTVLLFVSSNAPVTAAVAIVIQATVS